LFGVSFSFNEQHLTSVENKYLIFRCVYQILNWEKTTIYVKTYRFEKQKLINIFKKKCYFLRRTNTWIYHVCSAKPFYQFVRA